MDEGYISIAIGYRGQKAAIRNRKEEEEDEEEEEKEEKVGGGWGEERREGRCVTANSSTSPSFPKWPLSIVFGCKSSNSCNSGSPWTFWYIAHLHWHVAGLFV